MLTMCNAGVGLN